MGRNFYSVCHLCKVQLMHLRGKEGQTMHRFADDHYKHRPMVEVLDDYDVEAPEKYTDVFDDYEAARFKSAPQTTNQNSLDTLLLKFYLTARDDEVTPYSQETLQITKAAILEQTTKDMLALIGEELVFGEQTKMTPSEIRGYNLAKTELKTAIQAREEQTDV